MRPEKPYQLAYNINTGSNQVHTPLFDLDMDKNNFKIQKPKPVYDENGVIRYYEDDDYIYVRHNGELLDVE